MTHLTTGEDILAAREHLYAWLAIERPEYADKKYDFDSEPFQKLVLDMQTYGLVGGEWEVFLGNYKRRAELLGLDTPNGRQAFGKFIVTAMAALEHAIAAYGPMPLPAMNSGEVHPWENSPPTRT